MNKIKFTIWAFIIVVVFYILLYSVSSFNIDKINSPLKDVLIQKSTTTISTFFSEIMKASSSTESVWSEDATGVSSSTKTSQKDQNSFNFDGVYYRKTDLPVDFSKMYTPTGSIYVKVVSDEVGRARGLSGVKEMDMDVGMLFKFEKSSELRFWMKDMNFPLDIVWMDENYKIIDISENILPESYPNTISPVAPAKYVLEMNAKITSKIGLKVGKRVSF